MSSKSSRPRLDFRAIAAAALNRASVLVAQWLPGGESSGYEYKALNPTRGDRSKGSFSVNLRSGVWSDFATGDSGGDLISLYAYLNNLSQLDAAKEVAAQVGIATGDSEQPSARSNVIPLKPTEPVPEQEQTNKRTLWRPLLPAPDDAGPPPVAHPVRGRPQASYEYFDAEGRLLGIICRFTASDGGKEVLPCCYAEHTANKRREWRWMAFSEPRPLYGLYELAQHPDLPVVLVEGEKCADAGHELLRDKFVLVTWPGGAKAVPKCDFEILRHASEIYAWADCDAQKDKTGNHLLPESQQPGMAAMLKIRELLGNPDNFHIVDIPQPGEKPDGWDIADAIEGGMGAEELTQFILNTRPNEQAPVRQNQSSSSGGDDGGPPWTPHDLVWDGKRPASCLSNVYDILEHDKRWQGVIGYDEFAYRTMKLQAPPYVGGKVGEWTSDDDVQTAMWITRKYGFAPKENLVGLAVESLAKFHGYNPVKDYLRSLKWDGEERLNDWITDFIGAPKTEYVWRVSRWFLVGMVARAMQPGIKFDYCLVLEGEQGRGKSTLFKLLGGEWYGETDLDLHSKDSMSALRGKWVYEIAELGSLARSEATRQKSFFSRQIDEFRPVYGSREICCPRQLVFGGTTNEWEWNKDTTGGRRFWPVECQGEIDIDGLAEVRDQLLAEAYQVYLGGERFWPSSEEQRSVFDPEQFKRGTSDSYVDLIERWVSDQYKEFCIADVAVECLKIDAARLSRDIQTRIGSALRQLGCARIEKRTHAKTRYWYKSPTEMGHDRKPGRGDEEKGDHGIEF